MPSTKPQLFIRPTQAELSAFKKLAKAEGRSLANWALRVLLEKVAQMKAQKP
jgi:hypothetical protein